MTCIPDKITAGVTFDVTVTATAYPADDWQMQLHLRGPMAIDMPSSPDGIAHRIGASAQVTADWLPGRYLWSLRAARGAEIAEYQRGELVVGADIAALPSGFDARSHARRTLDAIEAVLENRATIDQEKYSINNRELWRTPISDLLLLRSRYRDEVRREQQSRRSGQSLLGRQVKVRF